jgi:hypothetical protein
LPIANDNKSINNNISPVAQESESYFALSITIAFFLFAGFITFHHEMWRDELGAWLISRDSPSLLNVFKNSRYEGHPSLWFILIWPLTRLTKNPSAIQWLNLFIAAASAFLIAKAAPAPRWVRAAAAFGYFPVYEYGSIARNYSLGLLGIIAFCAIFPRRRERPILLGMLLLLTANTSLPACLITIAALLGLVFDIISDPPERSRKIATWAGLVIAGVGIAISVLQMHPPPDTGYAVGWRFKFDSHAIAQVLSNIWRAYCPLPKPGLHFWESELLGTLSYYRWCARIGSIAFLLLASLSLIRWPMALAYFLIGSLGLLSFFYLKFYGYLRHHGFQFVCFATALWLARIMKPINLSRPFNQVSRWAERAITPLIPILLAVHIAGACIAGMSDYKYVFSAAKGTARMIKERGLDKFQLVGDIDYTAMPVLGYLDKKVAYYPVGGRFGSYVIWDTARIKRENVWSEATILRNSRKSPVLVLVDYNVLKEKPPPSELSPTLHLVGCQESDVVFDENYCVFLLETVPALP